MIWTDDRSPFWLARLKARFQRRRPPPRPEQLAAARAIINVREGDPVELEVLGDEHVVSRAVLVRIVRVDEAGAVTEEQRWVELH
jgi:hypothetical protein